MGRSVSSAHPRIRFFRGPTGHQVAYATHGSGPPLVCSAWWVSHVEEDWGQAGFRRFFERLGEHFTVVRYDRPGAGLSDRERDEVRVEDESATLEALCDHLDLSRLSLFGLTCAVPPALAFAARHPDRVERLILFGAYLRGADVAPPPLREAVTGLVSASWGMGSSMITDLFDPGLDAEGRKALSRAQRASATKDMAAKLLQLTFDTDVSTLAPTVTAPALVLHRKNDRTIPFAAGRALAAELPNATFQPLEGAEHVPWLGDVDAALDAVFAFLGASPQAPQAGAPYALARGGDVWTLTFDGRSTHLKDARGLADLAQLLAHPDRELHVGALASGGDAVLQTDEPVLDDEAMKAFRARLRAIDAALDEADARAASKLREERDAIAAELRAAVGLGGRKRALDPTTERARKAVTARLRASLKKITEALPAAGAHLNTQVITGTYCSYQSVEGVRWEVR